MVELGGTESRFLGNRSGIRRGRQNQRPIDSRQDLAWFCLGFLAADLDCDVGRAVR